MATKKPRSEYLDIEQVEFSWPCAAQGYEWLEQANVTSLFFAEEREAKPPFLLARPDGPFEDESARISPKLFLDFAELEPTEDAVLAFADKFGMLTEGEVCLTIPDRGFVNAESLGFWLREIDDMKLAVNLWQWIEKDDLSALRGLIKIDRKRGIAHVERPHKGSTLMYPQAYSLRDLRHIPGGEVKAAALSFLRDRINQKLRIYDLDMAVHRSVQPQLHLNDGGGFEPYLVPATLLSAMWLQILRAVTGERRYRRCPECKKWEDTTQRNRNWTIHEDCANRKRVREHRERRRTNEG